MLKAHGHEVTSTSVFDSLDTTSSKAALADVIITSTWEEAVMLRQEGRRVIVHAYYDRHGQYPDVPFVPWRADPDVLLAKIKEILASVPP